MKKVLSIVLAAVLLMGSFALAGCQKGSDTIKVGLNYELSGDYAMYGLACNAGAELALAEVNANGGINGKQIEVVKYDNKCDAAEATTLATKLMTQDKVLAIIGPALTGTFTAESSVAESNKVPVITGSATGDDVIATHDADGNVTAVKNYTFRICFNDSYQGTTMANFATETLGAKKAAIYADNASDYAKGLTKSFTNTFNGEIVATEYYTTGDTDFNAVLTSLKDKDFDVLFIPGYYSEVGLIIKQARALGIDCPILGADGFESPTLVDLAGADALSNVYYSCHYSALLPGDAIANFVTNYKAAHNGEEPNMFHAMGYDAAMFLCDAIARAYEANDGKDITSADVQAQLVATENFSGVTGSFSIDPTTHDPVKAIVVVELQNGKAVNAQIIG